MKVYILLENAATKRQRSDKLDNIVLGVFAVQRDAEECLLQHTINVRVQSNIELFFEDGIAYDESGFTFFEIVERSIQ